MNKDEVVQKLREAKLLGKGGAAFPTADKWQGVGESEGTSKCIVVNSSEGEFGLFKDLYVWRNHMSQVFRGIDYGIQFLNCDVDVYIHINKDYFEELRSQIFYHINDRRWNELARFYVSIEEPSYIGGEASALMNFIETGIAQPKPRTTRTVVKGLFDKPTMMNNVETFFDVANILDGTYDGCRFCGIFGDGVKKVVVRHKIDNSVAQILKDNNIKPNFDYYVQIGGGASGTVYNKTQLDTVMITSSGSIEIFDKSKRGFLAFLKRMGNFYARESCGKCMGKKFATSLNEKIQSYTIDADINIDELLPIINDMNKKTFCKLCKSFRAPFVSYCNNVLNKNLPQ